MHCVLPIGILVDLQNQPNVQTIMAADFKIQFTIRTVEGFEPLCDFHLGNSPVMALSVFSQLEGNDEVGESDNLQVDLVETHDGLPFDIKIKHCTLPQLGRSCCFITKEIFRHRNLGQGG